MSTLPPGPWGFYRDGDRVIGLAAADGTTLLEPERQGDHGEYPGVLEAHSPEVLRAIEALPELVAAARALVELLREEGGTYEVGQSREVLGAVLDRIDGEPPP